MLWAGQTALKFHGRTVVDEHYNGLALDEAEGDRIAASMGDADVVFMRNHGVMVVGATIAEAWDDLYYLERGLRSAAPGAVHGPEAEDGVAGGRGPHGGTDARGRWRERAAAPGEHPPHAGPRRAGLCNLRLRLLGNLRLRLWSTLSHRLSAVLVLGLLGGCHVLDQTDVPPSLGGALPEVVAKKPPPAPPAGPPPLLTIHFAPGVYYDEELRQAVTAAQARKPDVTFDVVSVVPLVGDTAAQVAAATSQTGDAAEVARAIQALGVAPTHTDLQARTDPGVIEREVRVYVH